MPVNWEQKLDDLGDAIKDLSTLDVVTLSGELNVGIAENGVLMDWSRFMSQQGNAQGNVTLIAATKIEIDADATNFITSTQPANFDALMKVHNASVQSAIESRRAVVELIKSLASGVV